MFRDTRPDPRFTIVREDARRTARRLVGGGDFRAEYGELIDRSAPLKDLAAFEFTRAYAAALSDR